MAWTRREASGFAQLHWGLAVVVLVAALVLTLVPVARDVGTRVASPASTALPVIPEPAGGADPRAVAGAGQIAPTGPAGAPSVSSSTPADVALAQTGIAVDAVPNLGEGNPPVGNEPGGQEVDPVIPGVAELFAGSNGRQSVYLRVRWVPAQRAPVATSYAVVCDRTSEPPEWVTAIRSYLLATEGNALFADRLTATTTGTQVVFNQEIPVPGALYACTVTPKTAVGDGVVMTAIGFAVPGGASFPEMPALTITEIDQDGVMMRVHVTDAEGNPTSSPLVAVRCTDQSNGTVLWGGQAEEGATVARVGPIIAGRAYSCVAFGILTSASAAALFTAASETGSLPATPLGLQVEAQRLSDVLFSVELGPGLPAGSRFIVELTCVNGPTVRRSTSSFVSDGSPNQQPWLSSVQFAVAGRWDCSAVVVNQFGRSGAVAQSVTVAPRLRAPTNVRLVATDVDRARIAFDADPVWIASAEVRKLSVACVADSGASVWAVLAYGDLEVAGGGTYVASIAAERLVTYTCDLWFDVVLYGAVDVEGLTSDPLVFTMPPGQGRGVESPADPASVASESGSPAEPEPTPPPPTEAPAPAPMPGVREQAPVVRDGAPAGDVAPESGGGPTGPEAAAPAPEATDPDPAAPVAITPTSP